MCAFSVCLLVTVNCQDFSPKISSGCILLKIDPNEAYEVFFNVYIFCECQKTSHMFDLDKGGVCYGCLRFWRLTLIAKLFTFSVLW